MPIRPNFLERLLIKFGMMSWPLLDLGISSFLVAALVVAGEVELFRILKHEPSTLEELAEKTQTDERALENLLQVLIPLGYIQKKNGRYSLTKNAEKTIPIENFHEMMPFFKEQAVQNVRNAGTALKEAPEEGIFGWEKVKSGEIAESYQESMRWLAGTTVDEVVGNIDLPGGATRMLDIGGSHGLYCVEMCRKYERLEATVLDWPVGIENARKTLRQEKDVADRIDTLEADFHEDPFPESIDFAFLGNIIHGNSPDENKAIIRKLAESTTDIGVIGIVDQFDNISGSRFNRTIASLIGWNLFLFANGRAYKIDEVKKWLGEVGFSKTEVVTLRKSPGFTLLIGQK